MKKYKVNVNGTVFEVEVEDITGTAAAAAPAAPQEDEAELVAVMMAAVADESGRPMGSFQITNVAPVAAAPVAAAPAAAAADLAD